MVARPPNIVKGNIWGLGNNETPRCPLNFHFQSWPGDAKFTFGVSHKYLRFVMIVQKINAFANTKTSRLKKFDHSTILIIEYLDT